MTSIRARSVSTLLSMLATLGLLTLLAHLIAVEELVPRARISGLRISHPTRSGLVQQQQTSPRSNQMVTSSLPQAPSVRLDVKPLVKTSLQVPSIQVGTPKTVGDARPQVAERDTAQGRGEEFGGLSGQLGGEGFLPVVESAELVALRTSPPRYPPAAERRGVEGKITVAMTITEKGQVADATVEQSTPPGVFDEAALSAVRRWQFRPVLREGKPSRVRAVQTIVFQLKR